MGGRSQAYVELQGPDRMIFNGKIHGDGPGLCTVRSNDFPTPIDISEFNGISFEVHSKEARIYQFGLHDRAGRDAFAWESTFEVPAIPEKIFKWSSIQIPFEDF